MYYTFGRRNYLDLNNIMFDAFISQNLNVMYVLYNDIKRTYIITWFICQNNLVKPLELNEVNNYIKYQK